MKTMLRIWILLLTIFSSHIFAASLGVWPINPRIDAPDSSTLVWVKNNNQAEPIVLQARIVSWKQVDGNDVFEQQDDLVVSPPIIEVKADAQQIFRVMNRNGAVKDVPAETTYRLLIDEVPKESSTKGSLLRFQMRYSMPLFVGLPEGFVTKPIEERMKATESGLAYRIVEKAEPASAELEVINKSRFHARISNLIISGTEPEKKELHVGQGLVGYVLPGASRKFPLDKNQLELIKKPNPKVTFQQEHLELKIVPEK